MSYTHLTREERYQIWAMLRTEHSVREIACTLDRSPSTISREIRRNSGRRGYRPKQAHDLAAAAHIPAVAGIASRQLSGKTWNDSSSLTGARNRLPNEPVWKAHCK